MACYQVVSGQHVTRVVLSGWTQGGFSAGWSHQGSLSSGWAHQGGITRVVLPGWAYQGGLTKAACHQSGFSSGWAHQGSLSKCHQVVAHQGGLIRAACQSLIRVVSHQGAPSVGSSLISLSSLENKVFEFS